MEWYVLVLVSAFLLGISQIWKKGALIKEHTLEFLSAYSVVIILVSLVLLPLVKFDFSSAYFILIYIKSLILSIAAFTFFRLLRHYDLSEVSPLQNISPVFLLIFSFLLLSERPSSINIVGVFLIVISAYVIESEHFNFSKHIEPFMKKFIFYLFAYLIIISFAAVMDKFITRSVDMYTYIFFQNIFFSVNFLIVAGVQDKGFGPTKKALRNSWLAIILATITVFLADLLYLGAVIMPATMISLIIPVRRISTVVATFIGGEVFHEKHLMVNVISCIIMVLGVYLVVV